MIFQLVDGAEGRFVGLLPMPDETLSDSSVRFQLHYVRIPFSLSLET